MSAHCTAQTTSWLSSWSSFLICPNLFQKWCPSRKTWKLRPELVEEVCSYPPFWPRFLLTSECWPTVAPLLHTLPSGIKTSKTTSSQSMAHQGSRRSQRMAEGSRKQMTLKPRCKLTWVPTKTSYTSGRKAVKAKGCLLSEQKLQFSQHMKTFHGV